MESQNNKIIETNIIHDVLDKLITCIESEQIIDTELFKYDSYSDEIKEELDYFIDAINRIIIKASKYDKKKNSTDLLENEIQKRKLAEEILRNERDFISRILDTANMLVVVYDIHGKIIRFNKFSEKVTGYKQDFVIGKNILDLFAYKNERAKLRKIFLGINEDKTSIESEWRIKNGEIRLISWAKVPILDDKSNIKYIICTGTDITELSSNRIKLERQADELKNKNNKLRESQKIIKDERDKAQKYLNIAEVIIIALDIKGNIKLINDTGCKIIGIKRNEILDKDWFSIAIDKNTGTGQREWFEKVLQGKADRDEYYESGIINNKGETRYILWKSTVLYNEGGEITGTLSSGNDITEQKEIEIMKSELINTVSHEIRTPLGSILGFSELIIKRRPDEKKIYNYINTIHKESVRLMELINDFLDLQRLENGKQVFNMKIIKLGDLLHDVEKLFSNINTHKLVYDKECNFELFADYNKMKQVFTNLISNAIKYSPYANVVNIEIKDLGDVMNFCIEDFGFGIEKKHHKNIFKNFYRIEHSNTLKIEGTGLGLSICKKIIKAHGGIIWVESKVGIGSRFYFSIPKNRS